MLKVSCILGVATNLNMKSLLLKASKKLNIKLIYDVIRNKVHNLK